MRKNALKYLEREWCSVYLILDEFAFDSGKIDIEAYFTLSHKSLVSANISKSKIQKTAGFKDVEAIHFVLIGQLGKFMKITDTEKEIYAEITSSEILDYAFEIIRDSSSLIPCRCVLVECSENPKVQKIYTDYGFSYFQFDGEHYQFYKRV